VRRFARRRPRLAYVTYLAAFALLAGYGGSICVRSYVEYASWKGPRLGFRGHLHRLDPELGYSAIPGAAGFHVFPAGPPIPTHYSLEGFRIPANAPPRLSNRRPYVLALGCSFTYGDGCAAEDAYPQRVADLLGGTALNAGKCAYGLAQMLILAQRLIPRYQPEYVLVQDSFWLIGRGTSGLGRGAFTPQPVPYLTLDPQGRPVVHPPPFRTILFDVPIDRYDNSARGPLDFLSYLFRVGIPLHVHDDIHLAPFLARRRLGLLLRAPAEQERLSHAVYREIWDVCRTHGSRLVLVHVDKPFEWEGADSRDAVPEALFVDAQAALERLVPERESPAYYRRFGHWRGEPSRLVDTHPNPEAHGVIARAVVRALRQSAAGRARAAAAPGAPS
jgi:hypothetical protein